MDERNRWIELTKTLRTEHGLSLLDAERLALSRPEWRRWVERRINDDAQCRRLALHHIRYHGASSLLVEIENGRLKVR